MSRTKTQLRTMAKQQLRYGSFQVSGTESYVKCPICGQQVHAHYYAWSKPRERYAALEAALIEHIQDEHPE